MFHPAIYRLPEIFRQEGWRYEGEGEGLCYQGVVFNEMKGALADPGTVLEAEMNRLLFPDNCYCHVSGGDPEHIPDLSYEQFIASHRKYYPPPTLASPWWAVWIWTRRWSVPFWMPDWGRIWPYLSMMVSGRPSSPGMCGIPTQASCLPSGRH